jgi:hypothetical protein
VNQGLESLEAYRDLIEYSLVMKTRTDIKMIPPYVNLTAKWFEFTAKPEVLKRGNNFFASNEALPSDVQAFGSPGVMAAFMRYELNESTWTSERSKLHMELMDGCLDSAMVRRHLPWLRTT